VVVSLQNGVDNVERIRLATGIDAVPAVVYVAAEMAAPGHVKHSGRGDLIIGRLPLGNGNNDLNALAATFVRAGIPCRVSANVQGELWMKLLQNCAYNALSAVTRLRYGRLVRDPGTRTVMKLITDETCAVARAAGVRLPDVDVDEAVTKLGEGMTGALSSTGQDLARGKRTEIDSLNGYLVRRGAELGIPTPVNQTLHALVKVLEQ
jgi:2-dehydropantoate 2-reductase